MIILLKTLTFSLKFKSTGSTCHNDSVISFVSDTDDWPKENGGSYWCIAATSGTSNWRVQTINLDTQGFTAEYLDEMRPAIEVFEW